MARLSSCCNALVICLALSLGVVTSTLGCGLDWELPTNHFDGVNEWGYVSYWEKIGELDCGDGLILPLHINFNSKRDAGAPSPYLGQGWLLPLLESKFVQESEDRFVMIQPDGLSNLFLRRGGPGGTVLDGSAGWKGEIVGETIKAWASCGWKLVFAHGHIISMSTPKGRKLDYLYEGGRVTELREGNATRLKVDYNAQGKAQALLIADGKRIELAQGKKPQIQSVSGQNIIAGVDSSLSRVVLASGGERTFAYDVDKEMLPTLTVSGSRYVTDTVNNKDATVIRKMTWDPQSRFATRDGAWTYKINPTGDGRTNAAIERTNSRGQKEYWFDDQSNGKRIVRTLEGITYINYRFTAGLLAGRTKRIEKTENGKTDVVYQASYDEKGIPIRTIDHGAVYQYEQGRLVSVIQNEKTVWSISYEPSGLQKTLPETK